MRPFNKVAVIGTGLIGGSIALAMKKKRLCRQVVGLSRHRESLALAKKIKAIDIAGESLESLKGADLLILAMPVSAIIAQSESISKAVAGDCLVLDVGSTKANIVKKLSRSFKLFVGTHPLAGSEKRGISSARPDLFRNSLCLITPTKNTDSSALDKARKLWQELGCRTLLLGPEVHDQALAMVSHLPHIAAFCLINSIPERFLRFSTASLKDSTRIAASDPELWAGILLDNRRNCLKAISRLGSNLAEVRSGLESNSFARLTAFFKKARKKRGYLK